MELWQELLLWVFLAVLTFQLVMMFLHRQQISHLGNKFVFVTGCDTGFGHQIALRLDAVGCRVIAGCYTEKGEDGLRKKASKNLLTVRLDVTSSESIREAVQFIKQNLPPKTGLWAVVNNAGIALPLAPAEWFSREDYRQVLEVNTLGMVEVTNQCLPLLKPSKGRVVLVASMVGFLALPRFAAYCMSKYAIEAFGDSLRRELSIWGMSVHILEPGTFKTGIHDTLADALRRQYSKLSPELKKEYGEEFVNQSVEALTRNVAMFPSDPSPVVDAACSAVTSLFPYRRYKVGIDSWLVFRCLRVLPDWLLDLLLRPTVTSVLPAACRKT